MKTLSPLAFALILALSSCHNQAKETIETLSEADTEVRLMRKMIEHKDSLLFEIGFNQIDTSQVAAIITKDFEFYHDVDGITKGRKDFLNSINGLGELSFKTWRKLVQGSMQVFPLYENNGSVLYGAVQHGVHHFYQQAEGEEARKSSTARFTHLWIVEDGDWRLKRVLSYDHQVPE